MPQPALHLLIASDLLHAWRSAPATALVDPFDAAAANAFLIGSLGPDLGLFPGGTAAVSRLAHTQRTGELLRALFAHARTDIERAFAWGWLSHITADVAIHPLVNDVAAEHARRRGACRTIVDHVRVEVGLDAWFAWRHPALCSLRLYPALDRDGCAFVVAAYRSVYDQRVTPSQLLQMQRGMLRFTRLAVHFATAAARHLCWNEPPAPGEIPAATALAWRVITTLSAPHTVVHAYLNPALPDPVFVQRVQHAMRASILELEHYAGEGLSALPDFNLETGALLNEARNVA